MSEKTESAVERNKRLLAISVLQFLQDEANNSSPDSKESIEVAMQCIESALNIDYIRDRHELAGIEHLLPIFTRALPSERQKPTTHILAQAEVHKNRGNDLMRNGQYQEAIDEYTCAIQLNPLNAVYFSNRAAAYSRLDNHEYVIDDCLEAVKLDPTYGKAFGRLGVAYSNLNMFNKAKEAYINALSVDASNPMYQENLRIVDEKLKSVSSEPSASADTLNVNISNFMNNPSLITMASQVFNDPGVRDSMSGILQMCNDGGNSNIDALLQIGQQLADQMQMNNPEFVDNLRRQFAPDGSEVPDNSEADDSTKDYPPNPDNTDKDSA